MTDFQTPAQSDFIRECQRLHALHLVAIKSGDPETIEAAIAEFTHFLRMNKMGRLQEYFAMRQVGA